MTLSDYHGLGMWYQLTHSPTYYQTSDEILLLQKYASEITKLIQPGSIIIDLGCGGVRKVIPLLDKLESTGQLIHYFALDLCQEWLSENIEILVKRYTSVRCYALWGSFTDGLEWIKSFTAPKVFLSLGSTLCNNVIPVAAHGLGLWAQVMTKRDMMVLGYDGNQDEEKVRASYITPDGMFDDFIRHGMENSNDLLETDWYKSEDWDLDRETEIQSEPQALIHRFVFRAKHDVKDETLELDIRAGERIVCYESFKYPPHVLRQQFELAGLRQKAMYKSPASDIYDFILVKDQIDEN
ncbi:hypothetical protein ABW19_dt0204861 [Dactylella cylindrospora]|nr:hypothetical protein ABW19_dt0204861 [Dactylella cylindrospora]